MAADRTELLASLIGRPYKLGAAGPDEFDCYGLTRYLQRELAHIEMSPIAFADVSNRAHAEAMLSHPERKLWEEIPDYQARDLDLVLMGNILGRDFHLGTFIRDGAKGAIYHVSRENGVVYDDIPSLIGTGFNYLRFFRRTVQ